MRCLSLSLAIIVACSDSTPSPTTTGAEMPDAASTEAGPGGPDGGPAVILAAGAPSANGIWSTSIAADGSHVYWLEADGSVKRVSDDGGAAETVASAQDKPTGLFAGASGVFWANMGTGQIMRLASGAAVSIATAAKKPNAVAADATYVYWVEQAEGLATDVRPGSVKRAALAGGAVDTLADIADPGLLGGIALLGEYVYFTDLGHSSAGFKGTVSRVKIGGAVEDVATDQKEPTAIASNGTSVAWTNQGSLPLFDDGSISELGAGAVVTDLANPGFIAVATDRIIWVDGHPGAPGRVMRRKFGGTVDVVANIAGASPGVAVDDKGVYWATGGSIWRAPR